VAVNGSLLAGDFPARPATTIYNGRTSTGHGAACHPSCGTDAFNCGSKWPKKKGTHNPMRTHINLVGITRPPAATFTKYFGCTQCNYGQGVSKCQDTKILEVLRLPAAKCCKTRNTSPTVDHPTNSAR